MKQLSTMRIQDPVLTQLAQGYHNSELICETLFPVAEMDKEGGRIPQFGRLAFRQHSTVRQLHGDSNRLTPEDITTLAVELEENDCEYPIDYREENDANYPLKQYALQVTQDVIALGREAKAAEIAQNADNYLTENTQTLTKAQLEAKTFNPLKVINAAKLAVSSTIGRSPNVCIISADIWEVLKENEILLERIKYTQTGILTPAVFAQMIDVDTVKIGGAMREENGQLVKIWQNTIILAYTDGQKDRKPSLYSPSYGYTVRRKNGLFVDTYLEKGGKVSIIRCTDISKPILTGKSAGFLIKING